MSAMAKGRLTSEQVAIGRALSRRIAATVGIGYYRFTTVQRTENLICTTAALERRPELLFLSGWYYIGQNKNECLKPFLFFVVFKGESS